MPRVIRADEASSVKLLVGRSTVVDVSVVDPLRTCVVDRSESCVFPLMSDSYEVD